MADRHEPPGYFNGVYGREAYRNRTWQRWQREASPPRRPPPPPRSHSNRNPRNDHDAEHTNAMDPNKRFASRSPEGGPARKHPRPTESRSPSKRSDPRSPSSNGPTRQSSLNRSNPASRRASAQIQGERRDTIGGPFVNSPEHGSSGRSTPVKKPSRPAATSTLSSNVEAPKETGNGTPNSVLDMLMNFSSHVAEFTALKISKDRAEESYNRIQLEYNESRRKSDMFPTIRDRKAADRNAAHNEFKAKEQALDAHRATQKQLFEGLASFLNEAATPKPVVSSESFVPRADLDILRAKYTELQEKVTEMTGNHGSLKNQIDESKKDTRETCEKLSEDLQQLRLDTENLQEDTRSIVSWRKGAAINLSKVPGLDIRFSDLAAKVDTTQKELAQLKSEPNNVDTSKFATKQELAEYQDGADTLQQELGGLRKTVERLSKGTASPMPRETAATISDSLAQGVETDFEFKQRVMELLEQAPEFVKNVESLQQSIAQLSNDVDELKDEVHEEGKLPMIKRVKKLDMIVNNLASKLENVDMKHLQQRVGQAEREMGGVQKALSNGTSHRQSPKPSASTSPPSSAALEAFDTRLSNLRDELQGFKEEQIDKDNMVDAFIDERVREQIDDKLREVRARITALDNSASTSQTSGDFRAALDETKKQIEDIKTSLAAKASLDVFKTQQNEVARTVRGLSELSDKVQAQQDKFGQQTFEKIGETLDATQKELEGIRMSLATKISIEFFNAQQNDVSRLSNEVDRLSKLLEKAKTTSQPPTPQPQIMPQVHRPSPQLQQQQQQLPNSAEPSPPVSGVRPTSGYGFSVNSGMAQAQQPSQSYADRIIQIQHQVDSLVRVTQHLKQRVDNVTTDDVVRCMLDQFHQIQPDFKGCPATVSELKNVVEMLGERVVKLEGSGGKAGAKDESDGPESLQNLKNRMQFFEGTLSSLTDREEGGMSSADLVALRESLQGVEKVAKDAKQLCEEHSLRFAALDAGDTKTKVENVDERTKANEKAFNESKNIIRNLGFEIETLKTKIPDVMGRIEALEDQLD